MLENQLLFHRIPLLERQANPAFGNYRRFIVFRFNINLVARLELRRTIFLFLLELWRTDTSPALVSAFQVSMRRIFGKQYGYG